ncbi:hypothetical protein OKW21_006070 [Catalinimonas alkaloidigena]|uniref:hypothetical protein n=1 Tax=Catalinimonas alkaloidigena TaxID=1075417 RepID=UPI002405709A|nr:hypothetical protein [Catalinimonas alkaloidigena]MDF9800807.1 hypothetical protein [Catalinimonas alkaloidigena]
MKTYQNNRLEFLIKADDLYVTADSVYKKIGYDLSNKQRWYQTNITSKYNRHDDFFYDEKLGLCVHVKVMEKVCTNLYYNQTQGNAIADQLSVEYHNFVKTHDWKESSEDEFYNTEINPKVSEALENIQPKKLSEYDFNLEELPDQLTINGKEYVAREAVEKDFVEANMKLEAMKSLLAG